MQTRMLSFSLALILLISCTAKEEKESKVHSESTRSLEQEESAPTNQQIVVVHTPDWNALQGSLSRYEWKEGTWVKVGSDWPVVIGKSGMAWGKGLVNMQSSLAPVKREGDKRSPAGIFMLGATFGYAKKPEEVHSPYIQVIDKTMCIEDGASQFYNQIIDEGKEISDWNSTDHMLRKDDLYEWGVFVAHNSPDAEAGKGSCIFLHVWRKDDSGTAGCTAMDKANMKELVHWLRPEKSPILIQMPSNIQEFATARSDFGLPMD